MLRRVFLQVFFFSFCTTLNGMTAHLIGEHGIRIKSILTDALRTFQECDETTDRLQKEVLIDTALEKFIQLDRYCVQHSIECHIEHYISHLYYLKNNVVKGKKRRMALLLFAQAYAKKGLQKGYAETTLEGLSDAVRKDYEDDQKTRFCSLYHCLSQLCVAQKSLTENGRERELLDESSLTLSLEACKADPGNMFRHFDAGSLLCAKFERLKDKNITEALESVTQAYTHFELVAKATGDARAQNNCGSMLFIKSDHSTDLSEKEVLVREALEWFLKAAQQKHAAASTNIAHGVKTLKALVAKKNSEEAPPESPTV